MAEARQIDLKITGVRDIRRRRKILKRKRVRWVVRRFRERASLKYGQTDRP